MATVRTIPIDKFVENFTDISPDLEGGTQALYNHYVSLYPSGRHTLKRYQSNPGCGSCRADLISLLISNTGGIKELARVVYKPERVKITAATFKTNVLANRQGLIRDIEDTEEAFEEMLHEVRNAGFEPNAITSQPLDAGLVRFYLVS